MKCPECKGTGSYHIPSDGYENSKSGRCWRCRGKKEIVGGEIVAYYDELKKEEQRLEMEIVLLQEKLEDIKFKIREI